MPADERTIAVYDERAEDYLQMLAASKDPRLSEFMDRLPVDARVLDLGCGPGYHAAAMQGAGFRVVASDASSAMVELAARHDGVEVRHQSFEELLDIGAFDGIWANFSLLHAERSEFAANLRRIADAMRPGGLLHLGMKTGSGERRDSLGRLYAFYTVEELRQLLSEAGFAVEHEMTGEGAGLSGETAPWVTLLARLA
jgi:SAM-dependent methyltransferase